MLNNLWRVLSWFSLFILISCSDSQQPNKPKAAAKSDLPTASDCSVTMGWDPWEPYMYLAPGDKVSGLDIEIIKKLADTANCELTFVQDDWMNLLRKVETGDVDLVAGASITEKRKQYALFSEPYRTESFVLYVRSGEKEGFPKSMDKILAAKKKIGVTTDYIYGDEVGRYQDDPEFSGMFVQSSVGEANYYNLMQHNVDAIIEDPFVGAYNLKRKGIIDQIEQLPITIHSGEVHLMFSIKSVDHTTVTKFNEALKQIKEDGTYQSILNKYML